MKKFALLLIILTCFAEQLTATHNRAGEITLRQIDEYTYEINITTFTYTLSQADRSSLEVQWGDNTLTNASRISITRLPNFYQKNVYKSQHTFPGAGTYEIVVQDPNRNLGVKNIPNSVNVVFSIKTTISINPSIGLNSTPVLLNAPIDRAALNQVFIHNPGAFDPDGDSLSYKLTVCTEEDGKPIDGYVLPAASDTLYIDPYSGDLTWVSPVDTGIYNIAIDVEEWRKGVKIGNIVRDMQIEVYNTDNNSPQIEKPEDICIVAGTDVSFKVIANDADNDSIKLTASGGPFILEENPASFVVDKSATDIGHSEGELLWETSCSHVREQFYTLVFKAEDSNPEIKLVDIKNVNIRILGPAPEKPVLIPASNSVTLSWNPDPCNSVIGYRIYRKEGPSGYIPDSCVSGVPYSTGYEEIAQIKNRTETVFFDDNKGKGLEQGYEYCYLIVSVYPDGALSLPSEETCTSLIAGTPAILQASVTKDSKSGNIELRWAQPEDLDTIPANGPYEFVISRYTDLFAKNLDETFSKKTADISDTIFIDENVDTESFPYSYTVVLYNDEAGNRFSISDTSKIEVASSFYPELVGNDNQIEIKMAKNVPWINYDYTIYRQNESSGLFDSIGFTTEPNYIDKGLINGKEYCYRVKSTGWRIINKKLYENVNISHINCTQPIDSTPPCTPMLNGKSFCDDFYNQLYWSFSSDSCFEDVVAYKLYYSPTDGGTPGLIEEYESENTDSTYIDKKIDESLTGCYYISAVDSFSNESPLSVQLCLDECSNYILPNVFSPNNDRINDLYIPQRTAYVEKVDFQVFNRWGLLIFQTDEPDINWDGKILGTNDLVSPGVYYYICEVFERRLGGIEPYTLTGFIYVFSGDENDVFIE